MEKFLPISCLKLIHNPLKIAIPDNAADELLPFRFLRFTPISELCGPLNYLQLYKNP